MSLSRYFHTLRHLRPSQIYGRLWHRIYHPRADLRPAPARRVVAGGWTPGCERPVVMLDANTFRFLNTTHSVRTTADWDDPARLRLWRYNLHYFDDLTAAGAITRLDWHRSLVARWITENPPTTGTGWEPYPVSLRIVNWIKWELVGQSSHSEPRLNDASVHSLGIQTRWLVKKLETHLLGNHLWANGKALVFAGVFFSGPEAESWLRKGMEILERELTEQTLPDGGHFERSPMYHAILLEDALDLINLSHVVPGCIRPELVRQLSTNSTHMLRWLRVMTHPDGLISLFNDAAFGIASDYATIEQYARRLAVPIDQRPLGMIEALPDSGYIRLQNERAVVICDVAPIGPDYLPGHAHADTLSFELSLDGQRAVVNSGTSTYESGLERQRQRSTLAHNTVIVDDKDSSEVWGSFRVARRARPFGVRYSQQDGCAWLEASHDGYLRLPGRVTHSRRWVLESNGLTIEDNLSGKFDSARAIVHFHPNVMIQEPTGSRTVTLHMPNLNTDPQISFEPQVDARLEQTTWHPEFGKNVTSAMLCASFRSATSKMHLSW